MSSYSYVNHMSSFAGKLRKKGIDLGHVRVDAGAREPLQPCKLLQLEQTYT